MHDWLLATRATVGALLLGALLVASTGCGNSPSGTRSTAVADDGVTPFAQIIAQMPKGSGDTNAIIAKAPEFERNILKDGKVTFDEYQKSVFATVQCAKAHGITYIKPPTLGPGRKYTYLISFGKTADKAQSLHKAFDACYQQYQYLVDIAWTIENKPSQDTTNKATAAFATCLREAGVSLPESPADSDFHAAQTSSPAQFSACSDAISKKFDIQGFAP